MTCRLLVVRSSPRQSSGFYRSFGDILATLLLSSSKGQPLALSSSRLRAPLPSPKHSQASHSGRREKLATYPKPPIASRAAFSQIQRFLIACSRLPARRVRSLAGMAPPIIFSKRVLMAAAMCR